MKRAFLVSTMMMGLAVLSTGSPALAANPPCTSGFATAVVHTQGDDHFRGKACYKESTDNWQYQDTYADDWSAILTYPNDSLSGYNTAVDSNGSNNGWRTAYSSYPEGRKLSVGMCGYDFSANVDHGCTVTNGTIS